MAQDMDKWRALVHEVVNSRVPRKAVSYLTSSRSAVVHKVIFQEHSTFVEKRQRVLINSSRSSDLLDWSSDTVRGPEGCQFCDQQC